jgi:hypothetical protein
MCMTDVRYDCYGAGDSRYSDRSAGLRHRDICVHSPGALGTAQDDDIKFALPC